VQAGGVREIVIARWPAQGGIMNPHTTPDTPAEAHPDRRSVPVALGRGDKERPAEPEQFTIDCAQCAHRETDVCDDCVVSFIVGHRAGEAVVVDAGEARAVRLLEKVGLVPGVRHRQKAS
jgi:hypothetical protein